MHLEFGIFFKIKFYFFAFLQEIWIFLLYIILLNITLLFYSITHVRELDIISTEEHKPLKCKWKI